MVRNRSCQKLLTLMAEKQFLFVESINLLFESLEFLIHNSEVLFRGV